MITENSEQSLLAATIVVTYIERFLGDVVFSLKRVQQTDCPSDDNANDSDKSTHSKGDHIEGGRMLKDLLASEELAAVVGKEVVGDVELLQICADIVVTEVANRYARHYVCLYCVL